MDAWTDGQMEMFFTGYALKGWKRRNRQVLTNKFLSDRSTRCQPIRAGTGTGGAVTRGGRPCLGSKSQQWGGGGSPLPRTKLNGGLPPKEPVKRREKQP